MMCGIFGTIYPHNDDLELCRAALNKLEHRGPDSWGEWMDSKVYIGHRRLSILDLTSMGKQPMIDNSGQIVLAVNGEIYNYRELKKELKDDCEFFSETDSEVILHGYKAWGL